jgi:ATP synthase protein I
MIQPPDALQANRVLRVQLLVTLVLAALGLFFGMLVAVSLLIGGGVCTLANALFALLVFRRYRAQEPGMLVMRFYGAEIGKIALILVLFAASFVLIDGLNLPALLGAYFVVQVFPAMLASAWVPADKQNKR